MTDTPQPTLAEQIAAVTDTIMAGEKMRLTMPLSPLTEWNQDCLRAVLATLQRVERMEAVVEAARETVAAIQGARPNIDAAVIRLSVANHLMSRLVALDAAAPETETVPPAHPSPPQV